MSEILEAIAMELVRVVPNVKKAIKIETTLTFLPIPMQKLNYCGGRLFMCLDDCNLSVAGHLFKIQDPHFFDDLCKLLTLPIGTIYHSGIYKKHSKKKALRKYWREVVIVILKQIAPSDSIRGKSTTKKIRPIMPLAEALRHIASDEFKVLMAWVATEERAFSGRYTGDSPSYNPILDRSMARKLMKKAFKHSRQL